MKAIENNSDMIEILQGKGVETLSSANYNPFGIQKEDDQLIAALNSAGDEGKILKQIIGKY